MNFLRKGTKKKDKKNRMGESSQGEMAKRSERPVTDEVNKEAVEKLKSTIQKATVEMEETKEHLRKTDESISAVEREIDRVSQGINALESNDWKEYWENLSPLLRHKFDHLTYHDKLSTERDSLLKKEQSLRDKEAFLLKKEEDLRAEVMDLKNELREKEAALLGNKRLSGKFGRVEKASLDELLEKFDASRSRSNLSWAFDFVEPGQFEEVIQVVHETISTYTAFDQPSGDSDLIFPVVDGASGTGKSRLCWEVGKYFMENHGAEFVFVDCSTESIDWDTSSEREIESCSEVLATVLFRRFTPKMYHGKFDISLEEILERIKHDTKTSLVLIQLDEYSKGQVLARMIVRACREVYRLGAKNGPGVLVVPILSGITYINVRKDLVEVSGRVKGRFFSLSGIEDVDRLHEVFMDAAGLEVLDPNLRLLMSTFGGFPRLFLWLLQFLQVSDVGPAAKKGELSLDMAKSLYTKVLESYKESYGIRTWADSLRHEAEKAGNKRLSERTYNRAVEHMKRLHTFAISGDSVPIDQALVPDDGSIFTLEKLSSNGLFTLRGSTIGCGTVYVPLIAIDACSSMTGIVASGALSPFNYSWATMEVVAMCTLTCRWNSIFFANPKTHQVVGVDSLRPGALWNTQHTLPKVCINMEIGPPVLLADELEGNMDRSFRTGTDGRGKTTKITDRTSSIMRPNQAGSDGMAVISPVAWMNQTKSLDILAKESTILTKGVVKTLVEKQLNALKKFDFGAGVDVYVFDLFTNRQKGAHLDQSEIPANTLVTTMENFEDVVGPLFARSKALFQV